MGRAVFVYERQEAHLCSADAKAQAEAAAATEAATAQAEAAAASHSPRTPHLRAQNTKTLFSSHDGFVPKLGRGPGPEGRQA